MSAITQLRSLLEHHEQAAGALRTTIGLLTNGNGHVDLLVDSATTRQGRKPRKPRRPVPTPAPADAVTVATRSKRSKSQDKVSLKERRTQSASLLSHFSTTEPRPSGDLRRGAIGPLVHRGYLRKKGDGYLRTAKEYTI